MIAEVLLNRDDLIATSTHAGCPDCPGGDECSKPERRAALGYEFPRCPLAMICAPAVGHVVTTYNAAKVSPLANWPDGYAAFVSEGVIALESAVVKQATATSSAKQTPASFWKSAGLS